MLAMPKCSADPYGCSRYRLRGAEARRLDEIKAAALRVERAKHLGIFEIRLTAQRRRLIAIIASRGGMDRGETPGGGVAPGPGRPVTPRPRDPAGGGCLKNTTPSTFRRGASINIAPALFAKEV